MAGMCGCCDMMSQWWHGRDYTVTRWAEQAGTTLWEVARRDAGPRSQPTLHSSQPRHSDTQWKYNQSSDDVKPSNTEKTKANTCASHLASKDYLRAKLFSLGGLTKIVSAMGILKYFAWVYSSVKYFEVVLSQSSSPPTWLQQILSMVQHWTLSSKLCKFICNIFAMCLQLVWSHRTSTQQTRIIAQYQSKTWLNMFNLGNIENKIGLQFKVLSFKS